MKLQRQWKWSSFTGRFIFRTLFLILFLYFDGVLLCTLLLKYSFWRNLKNESGSWLPLLRIQIKQIPFSPNQQQLILKIGEGQKKKKSRENYETHAKTNERSFFTQREAVWIVSNNFTVCIAFLEQHAFKTNSWFALIQQTSYAKFSSQKIDPLIKIL